MNKIFFIIFGALFSVCVFLALSFNFVYAVGWTTCQQDGTCCIHHSDNQDGDDGYCAPGYFCFYYGEGMSYQKYCTPAPQCRTGGYSANVTVADSSQDGNGCFTDSYFGKCLNGACVKDASLPPDNPNPPSPNPPTPNPAPDKCGTVDLKAGEDCCGNPNSPDAKVYNKNNGQFCCESGNKLYFDLYKKSEGENCCNTETSAKVANETKNETCCYAQNNNINICTGCQKCVDQDTDYKNLMAPGFGSSSCGGSPWRCSGTPYSVKGGQCIDNCEGCTQCGDDKATGGKICIDTAQKLADDHYAAHPGDKKPASGSVYSCSCGPSCSSSGERVTGTFIKSCFQNGTSLYTGSEPPDNCPALDSVDVRTVADCRCTSPGYCGINQKDAQGNPKYICKDNPCSENNLSPQPNGLMKKFWYDCGNAYCCSNTNSSSYCGGAGGQSCIHGVPFNDNGKGCATASDCKSTPDNGGGGGGAGDSGSQCDNNKQCFAGGGGASCSADADCANLPTQCNSNKQCRPGGGGASCTLDADCASLPSQCSNGKCVPGGGGTSCLLDTDCVSGCNGPKCELGGGGASCSTSADCVLGCSAYKQCAYGGTGAPCSKPDDCPSACSAYKQCTLGGSGLSCANPDQCVWKCNSQKCELGGTGASCAKNSDCVYSCTSDKKCKLGGGGASCNINNGDNDCKFGCDSNKKCTIGGAGASCTLDGGECNSTENPLPMKCSGQQCVPGGTGISCNSGDDCKLGCSGESCVPGGTGASCASPSDCVLGCTEDLKCELGGEYGSCSPFGSIGDAYCKKDAFCTSDFQCEVGGDTGIPCDISNEGVDCLPTCSDDKKCVIGGGGADCGSIDSDGDALCNLLTPACDVDVDGAKVCVPGGAGSECSADGDCQLSTKCSGQQCVPGGDGDDCDLANGDDDCKTQSPAVSNLSVDSGGYCSTGIIGGSVTFHWDAPGQTEYELQISTDSDFNDVAYDSCLANNGDCSGSASGKTVLVLLDSSMPHISYKMPYYWRVRAGNGEELNPNWGDYTVSPDVYTYPYSHPSPSVSYGPVNNPMPGTKTTFLDRYDDKSTYCFNDDGSSYYCNASGANTYQWVFGDGHSTSVKTCSADDPTICGSASNTYSQPNTSQGYPAILRICDGPSPDFCCDYSSHVPVGTSKANTVPQWREISPY